MKIAVIGTGYVGLVAGACLADLGNEIICVDVDEKKIESLRKAKIPIYEPGLEELVKKNIAKKRLEFTTDSARAIKESKMIFIAVGTPQSEDGSADLKYVVQAAKTIGENANSEKIVVDKSTVPVGTAKKLSALIAGITKHKISVVSNPEFLREGSAVKDFFEPDRVIVGSADLMAAKEVAALYSPLDCEILVVSPESAEMIKYASNAFLATKISFINEVANLSELTGANVSEVARGMGLDSRIGKDFLNAGCGYGGSCFPKDVKALQKISQDAGYRFRIIEEVESVNRAQKTVPAKKVKKALGSVDGKKIVLLGVAFKPNTDDMREASSIEIAKELLAENANVFAVDQVARENAQKLMPRVKFELSVYDAAKDADALILVTEWNEFLEMDFERIAKLMKNKLLIDGRNIYDRKAVEKAGIKYYGIGR